MLPTSPAVSAAPLRSSMSDLDLGASLGFGAEFGGIELDTSALAGANAPIQVTPDQVASALNRGPSLTGFVEALEELTLLDDLTRRRSQEFRPGFTPQEIPMIINLTQGVPGPSSFPSTIFQAGSGGGASGPAGIAEQLLSSAISLGTSFLQQRLSLNERGPSAPAILTPPIGVGGVQNFCAPGSVIAPDLSGCVPQGGMSVNGAARLPRRLTFCLPGGRVVEFVNRGRPLLYSGDLAASRRVAKVAGRARRGRRRAASTRIIDVTPSRICGGCHQAHCSCKGGS